MNNIVKIVKNYLNSNNANIFGKIVIIPVTIFIVIYISITSILQLIIYPIFWLITKILLDKELNSEITYRINQIYSLKYWGFK